MYFYFYSEYPSFLKLSGLYLGNINKDVKKINVDISKNTLVEVCPLIKGETPVNTILDENFLENIDERITVTDLKGGYFFKYNKTAKDGVFNVFSQSKVNASSVTVFFDNGLKISIESPTDFLMEEILFEAKSSEITPLTVGFKDYAVITVTSEKTLLLVYNVSGKIKKIFEGVFDKVEVKDKITATNFRKDILKHQVTFLFDIAEDDLKLISKEVKSKKELNLDNYNEKLVPYLFLEELLAGGDISPFLTESVNNNADMLKDFFGEFIGIMPPPIFREIDEVGLIRKKEEKFYYVDYYKFSLIDKKIDNIKCI